MRLVLLFTAAVAFCAMAVDAQAESQAIVPVAHGEAITVTTVGPVAGGFKDLKTFVGSTIKDGQVYPFAGEVAQSATYDGIEIDGPHLLIEGAAFMSSLDIYTSKTVVLRGVSIRPKSPSPIALLVRPGAGEVYVLWSDIGASAANAVGAAIALRGSHAYVYRSLISNAADGISIGASGVKLEENFIETRAALPGNHNDAIQLLGAPDHVTILRNKILNRNPQTSCVYLLGQHIDVRSNYLSGGGWTIYGGAKNNGHGKGAASDVSVTDTIFGRDYFAKSGNFGAVAYWNKASNWRDNRFSDGTVVKP